MRNAIGLGVNNQKSEKLNEAKKSKCFSLTRFLDVDDGLGLSDNNSVPTAHDS